jgi:signal transduction histidine kinase
MGAIDREPKSAGEHAGLPALEPRPALRALVVEDSASDYEYVLAVLREAGREVHARRVEDEPGMARALAEAQWDVVIADHKLPRFSAAAALATLRRSGQDLPFIIVSGTIGEEAAVQAMLAGADDYVMKGNLLRLAPAVDRSMRTAESRIRRREAERALRDREERLRAVTSNFPGVIFQLRYDTASERFGPGYFSAGTERLMGVSPQALGDTPGALFAFIGAADRASLQSAFADGARLEQTIRWEGRLKSSPGSDAPWVELRATPRRVPDAGELIWEGVIVDITARKRAEQQLLDSQASLRALSTHLESVREEEREHLATELHDEHGSLVTALKIALGNAAEQLEGHAGALGAMHQCSELAESVAQAGRRIALALRPPVLDSGIIEAARWQARQFEERTGIRCKVQSNVAECELGRPQTNALFRILQEALTNVAKHAQASAIEVQLFFDRTQVTLEVRDDGRGLPEHRGARPDAFGVRGMVERAHALGGWLEVSGAPGKGTTVMAAVPLQAPPAARTTP